MILFFLQREIANMLQPGSQRLLMGKTFLLRIA